MSKANKMRVVRRQPDSEAELPSSEPKRSAEAVMESKKHGHVSVADQVAESSVFYRNWEIPGARDRFLASEIEARFVERMYPYAKPTMLLVDFPVTPWENLLCLKKGDFLKEKGIRYLILKPDMTVVDATEALGDSDVVDNGNK